MSKGRKRSIPIYNFNSIFNTKDIIAGAGGGAGLPPVPPEAQQ